MNVPAAERAFRDGKITVEDIIEMILDGRIHLPPLRPKPDPKSPTWWEDVENYTELAPFSGLTRWLDTPHPTGLRTITPEDYARIGDAIAERRGITDYRRILPRESAADDAEPTPPEKKPVVFRPNKPYSEMTAEEIAEAAAVLAAGMRKQIAEQRNDSTPPMERDAGADEA